MNDRENALLLSFSNTTDFCIRKSDELTGLPNFNSDVTVLDGIVKSIRKYSRILEVSTQGYTDAKNLSKEALIKLLHPLLTRIQAHASISEDKVLQNSVKYTDTDIKRIYDDNLATVCRDIYGLCVKHDTALTVYGQTPEMLTSLMDGIVDYEEKLTGTPQYRAEQKAARLTLDKLFDEANELLKKKLDLLIEIIKKEQPEIYTGYKYTRKLELQGSRTMSLKGTVTDSATGEAVLKAVITIIQTHNADGSTKAGSELMKIVKVAATKGGFQIQSLPAGTYTITVTKVGYTESTATVYINDGELTKVSIAITAL